MRWLAQPSELPVEQMAAALLLAGVPVEDVWISEETDREDDEISIGDRLHVQSNSVETFFSVVESESMRYVCYSEDAGAIVAFVKSYLGIGAA